MTECGITRLKTVSIIIGIIVGILGVVVGLYQLHINSQIQSGEFILKLSERLDAAEFDSIEQAIFDNKSNYNLRNKFTETQIDAYLGQLETIGSLYEEGLISNPMAYDEFSYDFEKAYCNQSVRDYISDLRKKDGVGGYKQFFISTENMNKLFLKMDKKTCSDIDKGP